MLYDSSCNVQKKNGDGDAAVVRIFTYCGVSFCVVQLGLIMGTCASWIPGLMRNAPIFRLENIIWSIFYNLY